MSDPQAYATDVCVPLSRLPQIIVETKQDLIENRVTGKYDQAEPTLCRTNRKSCYAHTELTVYIYYIF